jgi:heterodisulfide reductase subunit C
MTRPRPGEPLAAAVRAGYEHCLSCHACRSVCPVQAGTGQLTPLKLLRLAALGVVEPLLHASELWYCLQCNRCASACPVSVAPSSMIRLLRQECMCQEGWSPSVDEALSGLRSGLQRARWHMADAVLRGDDAEGMALDWERWANQPLPERAGVVALGDEQDGAAWGLSACMTCGACSTVCPITHDRAVFDPVRLFRLVNLGQEEAVLRSPSLWLCLGCGRCSESCSQQVPGHRVIRVLQQQSIARGYAPSDMGARLEATDRLLLPAYLEAVQAALGR